MVLIVIFWILVILAILGFFAPRDNPNSIYVRASGALLLLLIVILGLKVFGNPFS